MLKLYTFPVLLLVPLPFVLSSCDIIDSSPDISSCLCFSQFRLVSSTVPIVPTMAKDSGPPVPRLNPSGATESLVQLISLDVGISSGHSSGCLNSQQSQTDT